MSARAAGARAANGEILSLAERLRWEVGAEFHDRLLGRLAKPQIAVACSRKLLRMMFAMVRDGTDYQPDRLSAPAQAVA